MTSSSDGKLVSAKRREPKPEFSIGEADLPAIKKWKVGKKYKLEMEVEMVTSSKGDSWDIAPSGPSGGDKFHARFKILSAEEADDKE